MNMGIHRKPIGYDHSVFLDSRIGRNDGSIFFPKNTLKPETRNCSRMGRALTHPRIMGVTCQPFLKIDGIPQVCQE